MYELCMLSMQIQSHGVMYIRMYVHTVNPLLCILLLCIHIVPLDITTDIENITANNGEDVSFTFAAAGSYFVNVTWLSPDNIPISSTEGVQTISTTISYTNVTSSLQFYNLQRSMTEGWYTCIAYAEYNFDIITIRSRAFLNVQGML